MVATRELFSSDRRGVLNLLYLGSFCIANVFMVAAPFVLGRARRGRAGVFLRLMTFWDLLTCSYLAYDGATMKGSVRIGWWMWEGSLIAMMVLLFLVRYDALENPPATN